MKLLRWFTVALLALFFGAAAWAQFSDVRDWKVDKGREFIRQIGSGVSPDSQVSFTVGVDKARRVSFFYRANRAAVGAKTCSVAFIQVSMNDTDYVDATGINGVTQNDNLTNQCVTDSCNNYDRYVELVANGASRIGWKFARCVTYWKVTAVGGVATSQIDSLRIRAQTQDD